MTGFGVGFAPLAEGRVQVEIRSLNHRFLDVRVRVPPELGEHSFFVEQLARDHLSRGRYDVGVRIEGAALPAPRLSLDRARVVYQALSELRDELAPGTDLPVTSLLSVPELLPATPTLDPELARETLRAAFNAAESALDRMRRAEGDALGRELSARLVIMRGLADAIRAQSGEAVEGQRARLRARLGRLLADVSVSLDSGRLEQEVAVLADRSDITEELVRLASHFDQLASLIASAEPIGRRLDFLLQEVAREVNTIGSKCQDGAVAHRAVELKSEVERMREQVQNVE